MLKNLVVRPDSVISRTAYLIDQRMRDIDEYTKFLNGAPKPEWKGVSRETVIGARAHARECLSDLLTYDTVRLIKMEFDKIRDEYIKEDEHDVRRTV